MSQVLENPATPAELAQAELADLYRDNCKHHPDRRVEIINGLIVVRELPTRDHAHLVYQLLLQLIPTLLKKGWEYWPDIKIFLHPQVDRYIPDIVIVPPSPRMWDAENVWGNETVLVVEVVSPGSRDDDHRHKPENCARAGVPLYLLIDALQGVARLLSEPGEDGYQQQLEVVLGKPLALPEPWDLTIDTGKLTLEDR